jgi:hypothetical protein
VTVAVPSIVIVPAIAVKLADIAPAATLTVAGTANDELLLEIATLAPPAGAALLNVTAQLVDPLDNTLDGEQLKLVTVAGSGASSDTVI